MQIKIRNFRPSDYKSWRAMWRDSVAHESAALTDEAIDIGWRSIMACDAKMILQATAENEALLHDGGLESAAPIMVVSGFVSGLAACTIEGELIGFLHYVVHPVMGSVRPVCYLQDMYVKPAYRSQGVGRGMIDELKKMSEDADWERIYWLVKDGDVEAESFYEGRSVVVPFRVHVHPTRFLRTDVKTAG